MPIHRIILALILLAFPAFARPQVCQWARPFVDSQDAVGILSVAARANTIVLAGGFNGSVDFDPGPGVFNMSNRDVFCVKLDSNGIFRWARGFLSNGTSNAQQLAIDARRNVYFVFSFRGTIDADPNAGQDSLHCPLMSRSMALVKLDADGQFRWAKALQSDDLEVSKMRIDAAGRLYLAGTFTGSTDFDPGPGVAAHVSGNGISAGFACALDSNGQFIWARSFQGQSDVTVDQMGLKPTGEMYLAGGFASTVDVDPGQGTQLLQGIEDVFLLRLDANGDLEWGFGMGSPGEEEVLGLDADANGNAVLTGRNRGNVDIDPGPDSLVVVSGTMQATYYAKYTPQGALDWGAAFHPEAKILPDDLALLPDGAIILTGFISQSNHNDLDPGPDTLLPFVNNYGDMFLLTLESNGDFRWGKVYGAADGFDHGHSLAVVGNGSLVLHGAFYDHIDLDSEYMQGTWGTSSFVAKFSPGEALVSMAEVFQQEIKFFPNPAHSVLHLRMPAAIRVQPYRIYNVHGSLVAQGLLHGGTNTIDVAAFIPGLYVLDAGNGMQLRWMKE